jgi:hypothetical protein
MIIAAGQSVAIGAISLKVASLTEGVLKAMLFTKLKVATVGLLLVWFILGTGIAAIRTSASAAVQTAAAASDGGKREIKIKWEYKAITANGIEKLAPKGSNDRLTDGLNTLGDQGWELVAVEPSAIVAAPYPGGTLSTYLFKRPK